ncbi:MAG TPA: hypothetical protein VK737_01145, partial [Opitutales bacterium]|nr:hypothetical protein [Opitutales bacterium]
QPTDWLFSPPTSHLSANLQAFYQRTAATSYYNEALANLQAALKTHTTPVIFAGYVGLDNAPHFAASLPEGVALWGFNAAGEWHSLYTIHGGQPVRDNPPSPENVAASLTPLVYAHELSPGN